MSASQRAAPTAAADFVSPLSAIGSLEEIRRALREADRIDVDGSLIQSLSRLVGARCPHVDAALRQADRRLRIPARGRS